MSLLSACNQGNLKKKREKKLEVLLFSLWAAWLHFHLWGNINKPPGWCRARRERLFNGESWICGSKLTQTHKQTHTQNKCCMRHRSRSSSGREQICHLHFVSPLNASASRRHVPLCRQISDLIVRPHAVTHSNCLGVDSVPSVFVLRFFYGNCGLRLPLLSEWNGWRRS